MSHSAPETIRDVACVVHVHSTYSDGSASVEELIEATRASGRDALLLTDHDTLDAARAGWEGRHGDVSLIVGHEVTPRGGHLLAFGLEKEIRKKGRTEAQIAAAVREAGGISFAAHPFSAGSEMADRYRKGLGRPHLWPGLTEGGTDGLELWSLTTDEAEAWRSPFEAIAWLRDPEAKLDGPPPHHLQLWDALCEQRTVVAIGGLDAHQRGIKLPTGRVLSPQPNERYFRMLATYVQIPAELADASFETERDAILAAMGSGRCYLGIDATAPARGFRFEGERGGDTVPMGSEVEAGEIELRVELPHDGRIRLLRGGQEIAGTQGRQLHHRVDGPGVYRVEARREARGRERAWILSNPIYLR
ncbi:CehA/McbA family metallohydrolase [Thermoleophilia bacterium SCSIO 60948]|nr:CehA/McbA family metallohydrolase [Thermoleophilia bacterium SCSIO 60948]